ncbi:hypothetical protein GOV06_01740 [Candidatus Woesearchaeota archaeon]|nr:hypothetical protein [Candidatus Woesearchaeota archaeon]
MRNLICPNTEVCPVYKNWEQKDNRLDIIGYSVAARYSCLALIAIYDPPSEGGIPEGEIEGRIKNKEHPNCALIQILNQSKKE